MKRREKLKTNLSEFLENFETIPSPLQKYFFREAALLGVIPAFLILIFISGIYDLKLILTAIIIEEILGLIILMDLRKLKNKQYLTLKGKVESIQDSSLKELIRTGLNKPANRKTLIMQDESGSFYHVSFNKKDYSFIKPEMSIILYAPKNKVFERDGIKVVDGIYSIQVGNF